MLEFIVRVLRPAISAMMLAGAGLSYAQASEPAPARVTSPGGHFEFRVDPWLSLHHFIYHFARAARPELRLMGRVPILETDRAAITPELEAALLDASRAYEPYLDTSLLFDADTRAIARALLDGPQAIPDPEVRAALERVMPLYMDTLWPQHQASALALQARLLRELERDEDVMARRLAMRLESSWSDVPVRVDILAYSNWAGAYTADDPAHITLSATDAAIAGPHALEILFHEAAHTEPLGSQLGPAAASALAHHGLESPRYWHALLFFVTGEVARSVVDDPAYRPYAMHFGLNERAGSSEFYAAMAAAWHPDIGISELAEAAAAEVARNQRPGEQP